MALINVRNNMNAKIQKMYLSIKKVSQMDLLGDYFLPTITTVDVSHQLIKVVDFKGKKVLRWANFSVDGEKAGDIQKVRGEITKAGFKFRKAYIAKDGMYTLGRVFEAADFQKRTVNRAAVLQKLDEVAPINEKQSHVVWDYIYRETGNPQIIALCIPKDTLEREIKLVKRVGFKADNLELRFVSLCRLSNFGTAVVINLESDEIEIAVSRNGVPVLFRSIGWNTKSFSSGNAKTQYLVNTIQSTLLEPDLTPYHEEITNAPMCITGPLTEDDDLMVHLTSVLNRTCLSQTDLFDSPDNFPAPTYAVNLGLALKDKSVRKVFGSGDIKFNDLIDINMIPPEYRSWRPSSTQIYKTMAVLLTLALSVWGYTLTIDKLDQTVAIQSQYDVMNNLLLQRQKQILELAPMKNLVSDYSIISDLDSRTLSSILLVREIADALSVNVKQFTLRDNVYTIVCEADSYLAFRAFVDEIEAVSEFQDITAPPEGYPFTTGGTIGLTVNMP